MNTARLRILRPVTLWVALLLPSVAAAVCAPPAANPCAGQQGLCFAQAPQGLSGAVSAGCRETLAPADGLLYESRTPYQYIGLVLRGPAACGPAANKLAGQEAWQFNAPTGAWLGVPLLPDVAPADGVAPYNDLRRFCEYRWTPAVAGAAPDPSALPDMADLRIEHDMEAVAASGFVPTSAAGATLETAWFNQIGRKYWPGIATGTTRSSATVRYALVDSSQSGGPLLSVDGADVTGTLSGHGNTMASVANLLMCGGTASGTPYAKTRCTAQIAGYNALPMLSPATEAAYQSQHNVGDPVPRTTGGYYGRQSDVAEQVWNATTEWLQDRAAGTGPAHLVINLSLGWDAIYSGSSLASQRVAGLGARLAVNFAACKGAIVVAAAGNRGRAADTGPMMPAGWETVARACNAGDAVPPAAAYAPIVYSVGAVDGADAAFALARPSGTPRQVAPAVWTSIRETTYSATNAYTSLMSGTSVAAASVSGIAATVWALRPALQPWEVMDLVYNAGAALPAASGLSEYEFRLNAQNAHWTRRRASLCNAIVSACPLSGDSNACLAAAPLLTNAALATLGQGCVRAAGTNAGASTSSVLTSLYGAAWPGFAVGAGRPVVAASGAVESAEMPESTRPLSKPQPGTILCPACAYSVTAGKLVLGGKLEPGTDLTPYNHNKVVVTWSNGTQSAYTDVSGILASGGAYSVFTAAFAPPAGLTVSKVVLHVSYQTGSTTTSSVSFSAAAK